MALVFDDRYQPREESAEALQRLFDVCFDSADAFSLSRAAWARQDHTLERALEPYVLRRLRTTRWFCYYTANSNPQRIALYPLNEQTKSILRAQYRGLFLEDWSGRLPRWVPSMEDLCFFRNGTLLLGTVSHERICMAYPEDGRACAALSGRHLRLGRSGRSGTGAYHAAGDLGQHRAIASLRFAGSFPPILRFEKFEIHTVFLHFPNLDLTKNLSPNLLAELCGAALDKNRIHRRWMRFCVIRKAPAHEEACRIARLRVPFAAPREALTNSSPDSSRSAQP